VSFLETTLAVALGMALSSLIINLGLLTAVRIIRGRRKRARMKAFDMLMTRVSEYPEHPEETFTEYEDKGTD
jgi:multisubunit Na+/H+ antiporter MnhF subunit